MYTPFTSKHFTKYTDPVSGQTIAVLTTKFAPIQQVNYFTNPGGTKDGRYYWFSCSYPSGGGRLWAVIDFETDEMHLFPETHTSAGPMIDQETGYLYFNSKDAIFYRTPNPWDRPVKILDLPEEIKAVDGFYSNCHLSFNADRKDMVIECITSKNERLGGFQNLETGEYTQLYYSCDGVYYDHTHGSPTDPDLISVANDLWDENIMAYKDVFEDGIFPRLNIITRDGKRTVLKPYGNCATHEWWAADGKGMYYINNYLKGTDEAILGYTPIDGGEPEVIFSACTPGATNSLWHGHCSQNQKYFVADAAYPCMGEPIWRGTESMLYFHNHITGKTIKFLTKNPVVEGWSPKNPCWYHIDPHPSFTMDDRYIAFTTTVLGHVDLAFADVASLIEATK